MAHVGDEFTLCPVGGFRDPHRFERRPLRLLAIGDQLNRAREPRGLSARVEAAPCTGAHPLVMPCFVAQPEFHVVSGIAAEMCPDVRLGPFAVLRMNEIQKSSEIGAQLRRIVSEHLCESRREPEALVCRVEFPQSVLSAVNGSSQPLFRGLQRCLRGFEVRDIHHRTDDARRFAAGVARYIAFFVDPAHPSIVEHHAVFALISCRVAGDLVLGSQYRGDVLRMDPGEEVGAVRRAGGFGKRQELEVVSRDGESIFCDIDVERCDARRGLREGGRLRRIAKFDFQLAALVDLDRQRTFGRPPQSVETADPGGGENRQGEKNQRRKRPGQHVGVCARRACSCFTDKSLRQWTLPGIVAGALYLPVRRHCTCAAHARAGPRLRPQNA